MALGGALVTQSTSPFFARRSFWCINRTLAEVFDHTLAYNTALPSFGIWGFNLATRSPKIPEKWQISVNTRAIGLGSIEKAAVFDSDIGRIETATNSLFKPILFQFYIEDIRK